MVIFFLVNLLHYILETLAKSREIVAWQIRISIHLYIAPIQTHRERCLSLVLQLS